MKSINESFDIDPKTIIINESKLTIPKNIDKFSFKKAYDIKLLSNTLIFTLNKLIRKKHYYYELVKNEILKNSEEIKDYKFLFCLIYNNIPIKNIDDIAEKDLQTLINKGYIKDEFKLKIIYLIPNLGSYNLNTFQKNMKIQMDNKIDEIKKDMEKQHKTKIDEVKREMEKNNQNKINEKIDEIKRDMEKQHKTEINEKIDEIKRDMEKQHKTEIDELKKNFEKKENKLLMKYNILSFQFANLRQEIDSNNKK